MRRLEERIEIETQPEEVWRVLGSFGDVACWAPYVIHSRSAAEDSGVGSRRTLRHAWGFQLKESVVEWNEGEGYSFVVAGAPFPMRDITESWAVAPSPNSATVITTVEYRMHLGVLGSLADRILVQWLVRREMRAGLKGLKRFVERNGAGGKAPA
jgi:hypothetical protein